MRRFSSFDFIECVRVEECVYDLIDWPHLLVFFLSLFIFNCWNDGFCVWRLGKIISLPLFHNFKRKMSSNQIGYGVTAHFRSCLIGDFLGLHFQSTRTFCCKMFFGLCKSIRSNCRKAAFDFHGYAAAESILNSLVQWFYSNVLEKPPLKILNKNRKIFNQNFPRKCCAHEILIKTMTKNPFRIFNFP